MGFRREIARNRLRLRLLLLGALALSAIAGRMVGNALLFTVEPERAYRHDEAAPRPPWYLYYPNHVAGALMLLVWVQYVRMRARGDLLLLGLVGARPLAELRLQNAAEEMAIAAGIPAPRLHVVEDPSLNAFACGARDRSAIVVTRGLLERLDRDELQGVLAHETAHIRNGDTLLMTALFGLSRVFGMTAGFALGPLAAIWRASRESGSPDAAIPFHDRLRRIRLPGLRWGANPSAGAMAAALIVIPLAAVLLLAFSLAVSLGLVAIFVLLARNLPWIALGLAVWELWKLAGDEKPRPRKLSGLLTLTPVGLIAGPAILLVGCAFPFLFWMLRLAISRNREFQADATAVELTRYPEGLRSALERLLEDDTPATALPRSLSPLAIASVGPRRRDEAALPAA
ncbi:MAG: M48 family metalloprotease, partial [Planctomycetes bacterium]|nr:M48 family metalloprotease [Planctomycetota bacterium]